MPQAPFREVQDCFEGLLARVEAGETILITRTGRSPIRLGPVQAQEAASLPSLHQWREAVQVDGQSLSETVRHQRAG